MIEEKLQKRIVEIVDSHSPRGWVMIDRQFQFVYVNQAMCQTWRMQREELEGHSLLKLFYNGSATDSLGRYHGPLIETMSTGREFKDVEAYLLLSADRSFHWYQVNTYAMYNELGEIEYALGTYAAIDEFKLSQDSFNMGIIRSLCKAIGARDAYTMEHTEHVAELMVSLADHMKLPLTDLRMAYLVGIVHDIGKIGIPELVLNKPGRLTDDEYEIIKQHPIIGADILAEVKGFAEIAEVVRHHHERYDGSGYPGQLAAKQIPLFSRMLAICDAYDAMTNVRCYRHPFEIYQALAEIDRCAGTQFDPDIGELFIECIKKFHLLD